ncbi:uncharacterized protein [Lolium perenne]|uniref:uncharacterized protein n=1 Tax=Lolium perenne TaxID=4522 RepID=UPI0021F56069|nr:uncharacterized protein LOC127330885 [Lolium perenne]
MGNFASAGSGAKIVMPDGTVRALGEPVSVAELMVEHPCHFVVDAWLVSTGAAAKVAALLADDVLDGAGVYVVLPAIRGRVYADDVRRVLATASRPLAQYQQGHNTVNNIAIFYEGILMSTNDFMQERLHPDSKNFGEQLVNTSEKTDRSILGYLLGIRDFWEEGYDAIVKPLNIQGTFMEGIKQIHDITFNNVPAMLQAGRHSSGTRTEGLGYHQPEFLSRQMTSRGAWKPSLKTIEELWQPRKIPHWLSEPIVLLHYV